jgi:hypothetical protein
MQTATFSPDQKCWSDASYKFYSYFLWWIEKKGDDSPSLTFCSCSSRFPLRSGVSRGVFVCPENGRGKNDNRLSQSIRRTVGITIGPPSSSGIYIRWGENKIYSHPSFNIVLVMELMEAFWHQSDTIAQRRASFFFFCLNLMISFHENFIQRE